MKRFWDKMVRGRHYNGTKESHAKITREIVEQIRQCRGLQQREIAILAGISQTHVGRILRNEVWA